MTPVPQAEWTVLLYMAGDNSLEGAGFQDLEEVKRGLQGLSPEKRATLHVVAQFDTVGDRGTLRYHLTADGALEEDQVGEVLAEVNTGDPQNLVDFIRWGVRTYPAQKYALVIWNHGNGWDDTDIYASLRETARRVTAADPRVRSTVAATRFNRALFAATLRRLSETATIQPETMRGILYDDTSMDFVDNQELATALRQGLQEAGLERFDLLGFDACLMSMVEVAYQVRLAARVVIGSQAEEPAAGWDYQHFVQALPGHGVEAVARATVRRFREAHDQGRFSLHDEITQSAISTAGLSALVQAVDRLAHLLLCNLHHRPVFEAVDLAREQAERFRNRSRDYLDLVDFVNRLAEQPDVPAAISEAARRVAELAQPGGPVVLANEAVRAQTNMPIRAHGLSIYFPRAGLDPDVPQTRALAELYRPLDFARDTRWDELLTHFAAVARASYPPGQPLPRWPGCNGQAGGEERGLAVAEPVEPVVRPRQAPLRLTLARGSIGDVGTEAIVVNHVEGVAVGGAASFVDQKLGGVLSALIAQGSLTGHAGRLFFVPTRDLLPSDLVVVVGLGTAEEFGVERKSRLERIQTVGRVVAQAASLLHLQTLASIVHGAGGGGLGVEEAAHAFMRGLLDELAAQEASSLTDVWLVEWDEAKFARLADEQRGLPALLSTESPLPLEIRVGQPLSSETGQAQRLTRLRRRLERPEVLLSPAKSSPSPLQGAYLSVLVSPDGRTVDFTYMAPTVLAGEPRTTVPRDPTQYRAFLRAVDDLARASQETTEPGTLAEQAQQRLAALRDALLPPPVREMLAELPDDAALTWRLDRETAGVPWELLPIPDKPLALARPTARRLVTEVVRGTALPLARGESKLRLLIVANPTGDLPWAEAEAQAIEAAVAELPHVEVTRWHMSPDGSALDLLAEFPRHHIVHFAGHALYDEQAPALSRLLLDRNGEHYITAQNLAGLSIPPLLLFLNACESGRQSTTWERAHTWATGLADASIAAGSRNVLATFWNIGDEAAQTFARVFYGEFFGGAPLGVAVHRARSHLFEQVGWSDLTWASYLFYGDPFFTVGH